MDLEILLLEIPKKKLYILSVLIQTIVEIRLKILIIIQRLFARLLE